MNAYPPRVVPLPSWRQRLVLFAAILSSSIALSPAAGRLRDPAEPLPAAGTYADQRPRSGAADAAADGLLIASPSTRDALAGPRWTGRSTSLQAAQRQGPPGAGAANASTRSSAAGGGRLLVDGRVTPDAISDATAALVLLRMIAPSADNTVARERQRQIMLADAAFSAPDAQIVQRVLEPLHREMDEKRRLATAAREAAEVEPTAVNMATLKAAAADLRTPATVALARLERELSPDGVARLRRQLDWIKANTKIYGPQPDH